MRPFIYLITICTAALVTDLFGPHGVSAAEDALTRSRAAYGSLQSYADTGVIVHEYGTSSQDRHTFTTAFNRLPRRFRLEFTKQNGDRFIVWGDPDAFHTWWKATGVQRDYPNPDNSGAITMSAESTVGATSKVPTLLYAKAALPGSFSNLTGITAATPETVDGHRCERVTATASDVYGTGHEVNARKVTFAIDAESLLIRRVVEEWPALPGQVSRTTTTYQPQLNPQLDESRFRFTPR
jgi:outer membrane lipoprotein-sorting protein